MQSLVDLPYFSQAPSFPSDSVKRARINRLIAFLHTKLHPAIDKAVSAGCWSKLANNKRQAHASDPPQTGVKFNCNA